MPTLQDRIVWITGAGSGIGRAIAIGFAAAGARVALTGRRADALARTASEIGEAAIVVPADVTNADQVVEAYQTVKKAWGAVEVLVNRVVETCLQRCSPMVSPPMFDHEKLVRENASGVAQSFEDEHEDE